MAPVGTIIILIGQVIQVSCCVEVADVNAVCQRRVGEIARLPASEKWSPLDDVAKVFTLRYTLRFFAPDAELLSPS